MTKASEKRAGRKKLDASTGVARAASGGKGRSETSKKGARRTKKATAPAVGISGVPGSKNDSRRCSATANRTGERCRAPAIKGGTVCRVHGGSLPQVKAKAKERLLELVDPALVALRKVLTDPDVENSAKVRAALGILDRSGFGPGQTISVGPSKWDAMFDDRADDGILLDRTLGEETPSALTSGAEPVLNPLGMEDYEQHSIDEQIRQWADYDRDDAEPYTTKLDPYDGNTVQGEVVSILPDPPLSDAPGEYGGRLKGRYDVPPDLPPDSPPRYDPASDA